MILIKKDTFKYEMGEPIMRTCWKCNAGHKHLKKVTLVHVCFACGKYWLFGKYLDKIKNVDKWLKTLGLKYNDSTLNIKTKL